MSPLHGLPYPKICHGRMYRFTMSAPGRTSESRSCPLGTHLSYATDQTDLGITHAGRSMCR